MVVFCLNPRGSMGTQIQFLFFSLPFAITVGLILGGIPLYTSKKFSIAATIASLILSILGFYLFLFMADMAVKNRVIAFIGGFSVLVLPSLIGDNFFSWLKKI